MKESVGGISLTMIVITLILLFAGIMSMTISRSNAIAVKDKVMRIVEEYDGFDINTDAKYEEECEGDDALCDILETLNSYSYRQTGTCPSYDNNNTGQKIEVAGFKRNGSQTSGNDAAFCIVKTPVGTSNSDRQLYYYKIIMFYGIDIPVIKTVLNFTATGETKMLNY